MSKHDRKQNQPSNQPPRPADVLAAAIVQPPIEIESKPEEVTKPAISIAYPEWINEIPQEQKDTLELLKTMPVSSEELRKVAIESYLKQLTQLREQKTQLDTIKAEAEQPKRLADMEAKLKADSSPLLKLIADTAKECGVTDKTLAGKVLKVTFPDGKFTFSVSDLVTYIPSKGRGGGGKGFTSHAAIEYHNGEQVSPHKSLHALAISLGVKYTGRPSALEAITDPRAEDGSELPMIHVATTADGKAVHYVPKAGNVAGYIADPDGKPVSGSLIITRQPRNSK